MEFFSFLLWILFTIFSIALAGLGAEGILFSAFILIVSGGEPGDFPLATTGVGCLGIFLSVCWWQFGVDRLHYLVHDAPVFLESESEEDAHVLHDLIREVETSSGDARSAARVKAKAWLISNVSSLDEEDIHLAKTHFGYLLPAGWGIATAR